MRRSIRRSIRLLLIPALLLAALAPVSVQASSHIVNVGMGSYTTQFPAVGNNKLPANNTPYVTAALSGTPIPTSDWWTSLVFKQNAQNPSENLFIDPTAGRFVTAANGIAGRSGLQLNQPRTPFFSSPENQPNGQFQFLIGVANAPVDLSLGVMNGTTDTLALAPETTLVSGFGDWHVDVELAGGKMTSRLIQGSPFTFVSTTLGPGEQVVITVLGNPTIDIKGDGTAHVVVNGNAWGIYGLTTTTWTQDPSPAALRSNAAWYSVAALPDTTEATFNDFKAHAFALVTGTQVAWAFDAATNRVQSTYTATTTSMQGPESRTLMGLYRNQYLFAPAAPNTPYTYTTQSGPMKVMRGNTFTTAIQAGPMLPWFPIPTDPGARTQLDGYATEFMNLNPLGPDPDGTNPGAWVPMGADQNTYGTGQGLQRTVDMVPILDQLGRTTDRDRVLDFLKRQLQTYFTASGPNLFYYDFAGIPNPQTGVPNVGWGTLIGYPAGFGSDEFLNDHNLTYGYFVRAAALVALYDPVWAQSGNWGGMVEMLIRDVAAPTRNDALFPFLRNYSSYKGHSWASGAVGYADGANQESSSESMNFAVGVYLWGLATGNTSWRDLGAFLYANEAAAIEQYYFDVDQATFPDTFAYPMIANRWGDGGCYCTFFGTAPKQMLAIEVLPAGTTGLYLGTRPGYVQTNLAYASGRTPDQSNPALGKDWSPYFDPIWRYQSLVDGAGALATFNANASSYIPFNADTKAATFNFLDTTTRLGMLDTSVTADVPTYAVFMKPGTPSVRTCMAFNPTAAPITVNFSNGASIPGLAAKATGSVNCAQTPPGTTGTVMMNSAGGSGMGSTDATFGSIGLVFQNMSGSGSVTVSETFGVPAPPPPGTALPLAYTTSGAITASSMRVCVPYPEWGPAAIGGVEGGMRLWQLVGATWTDITLPNGGHDPGYNVVCGQSGSFGTYALAAGGNPSLLPVIFRGYTASGW